MNSSFSQRTVAISDDNAKAENKNDGGAVIGGGNGPVGDGGVDVDNKGGDGFVGDDGVDADNKGVGGGGGRKKDSGEYATSARPGLRTKNQNKFREVILGNSPVPSSHKSTSHSPPFSSPPPMPIIKTRGRRGRLPRAEKEAMEKKKSEEALTSPSTGSGVTEMGGGDEDGIGWEVGDSGGSDNITKKNKQIKNRSNKNDGIEWEFDDIDGGDKQEDDGDGGDWNIKGKNLERGGPTKRRRGRQPKSVGSRAGGGDAKKVCKKKKKKKKKDILYIN
jgi:hypothetical protein